MNHTLERRRSLDKSPSNNSYSSSYSRRTAVYGIYQSRVFAENAMARLKAEGFRGMDLTLLSVDRPIARGFSHVQSTKAPEGALIGGGSGAVFGGVLGCLAGLGLLTLPEMESLAVAGPILGSLSGVGVGSLVGGIAGGMVGFGVPEYEARKTGNLELERNIVLSVLCDDVAWKGRAMRVLASSSALDVASDALRPPG